MHSPNAFVVHCEDRRFAEDEANVSYANHFFTRLSAKEKNFTKVDFKYCTFDRCYLRSCKFLNCDFTGCRFVSSNFHGSSFRDCRFDYTSFERTQIAPDILDTQAPFLDNLKEKFARSLRVNYSQLGDAESVNKAIKIELDATKTHLYNAWHSEADYYRKTKYPGAWMRFKKFVEWVRFMVLHFVWGNGESAARLLTSIAGLIVLMAIYHLDHMSRLGPWESFLEGLRVAPEVFLGVRTFPEYGHLYLAVVATARLLSFAALTSILIKRFSRR
jgi:hypothetical protein